MSTDGVKGVPEDFPRGFTAASIPGTQPKFLARKIGDRFVVGLTEEELYERWSFCEDLARQLTARTQRKQEAGLISDFDTFYKETERRVRGQGWNLSEDEVQWLMKRTRSLADDPQ
mgnify:CR=1 FL=1